MSESRQSSAHEFRDWSVAAVKLLQGVIYSDEPKAWDILLRSRSTLEGYFSRIGLQLVVDEPEGYAFLRQWHDDEWPEGWEPLPKLLRRVPLGYGQTLLAVLLRDELRRFDEEDIHNERCVVEAGPLFDQWKVCFPVGHDEVRLGNEFKAAVKKLEELGFIGSFPASPDTWEVRRILKARLPVEELENLKEQLAAALPPSEATSSAGEPHG
jgi:hypothetical protein